MIEKPSAVELVSLEEFVHQLNAGVLGRLEKLESMDDFVGQGKTVYDQLLEEVHSLPGVKRDARRIPPLVRQIVKAAGKHYVRCDLIEGLGIRGVRRQISEKVGRANGEDSGVPVIVRRRRS